ncbi:MAG: nucleotidyltransferase domain-containing protein [Promethearchaeota archaeon]|nr:MAG: nucleotidyltransferase domain-containing protein [Candidatus Lokiarchaeota archaeon]
MTQLEKILEIKKKRANILRNFQDYLNIIVKKSHEVLNNPKIYLFGSALQNKLVASSDIDILIVAEVPKKHLLRTKLLAEIEEKSKLPLYHPFDIHLIDFYELKKWKKIYKLKLKKIN